MIREVLYEGADTTVYGALRTSDRSSVVLKVLDPRRCSSSALERLRREYEIGTSLTGSSFVRTIALETYREMPALVREEWGRPLEHLLGEPMPAERFLELAMRITAAVAELHHQGVIHKDLKPRNILVHAHEREVKLADFGIATRILREQQSPRPPQLVEGTLPYMSPEQTGRMNRVLDSRTDLYSLGVTFFRMLTGRLPFEARDALGWLHCHVARPPPPPSRFVPELPEVLDQIVTKLLAKRAEDRYQTARGIEHDLARCLEQLRTRGRIEPFTLGERDVPDRLQIPQKLYGREEQVGALLRAFERVASTGAPELVLVSGYSGIGKSSVVRELEKPILGRRGLLAQGKFDQYRRDIPYSTIAQAFRGLVLGVLVEDEEHLAAWRERLRGSLGMNARLVVDVIPELALLLGEQSPVPQLPLREAKSRFHMVFRHFVGAFAREEHPLTLFLDDLQWADAASLELLTDLLTHAETRHVLALGAYRDNEVGPAHPVTKALDGVRASGLAVHEIVLAPLSREHLRQFVADAMRRSEEEAEPVALLLEEKTAGNPYFAIQFLTSLEQDGLLQLDSAELAWHCDVAAARARGYTGNVIDLMIGKLRHLPSETQEALQLAACVGATVEVEALTTIFRRNPEPALRPALQEGLLVRLDRAYRFPHDRVQEAAYSLIPDDEREAVHLGIGRLLLARTPQDEVEDEIFEIVNQLDRGAALITSREERERYAELNLVAGKRARRSTAYASALKYLAAGTALLADDGWSRRYELTFALELHRAECEYLTGALKAAEERLSTLWHRAGGTADLAAVTCLRLDLYTTLDQSDRGVQACLEYLARLHIQWSAHPTREEVREEYERIWRRIGSRPIEELVESPPMSDPDWRATMDVLTSLMPAALFTDENLLCLSIGRMANLSLEHGHCDGSSLAYVWLGMILGPYFGDFRAALRFGELSLELVEKRGLDRFKARVYLCFANFVNPWARHLRTCAELQRRAFHEATKVGDLTYAAYSNNSVSSNLLSSGEPLGDVQRETERGLAFARKMGFGVAADIMTTQLALIRTLRGLTPSFSSLDGEEFDEARFEQRLEQDARLAVASCWYWIRKLQARVLAEDYANATRAASNAGGLLWTTRAFFEAAEYHTYAALARAGHHDTARADERPWHREALVAHRKQLAVWAENCPENFRDRHALVSAELARIEGRALDAEGLYEQAIRSARDNGFVHNEALAYELASKFYRARGYEQFADVYLRDARACYLRWGADGKVKQLERVYPQIVERGAPPPAATFIARTEQLELLSVVKASQAISGEIEFEKLAGTLLQVALEQGGARKSCLVLERDGAPYVEAEAGIEDDGVQTRSVPSLPVESSALVPASVLQYARAMRQPVVLDDASASAGKFQADPYFSRQPTRSVLCLPILRQATVVGLLYLENRDVAGAFTPDRLTTLSLLASQAAISVENARFLREEREARERAAFLSEAGALLSESLDYEQTLARLSRLCVESLADWCVLDLLDGREIRRLAGACADPVKDPLLDLLRERHPARWDSSHPAAECLRAGEPLLVSDVSDDYHRSRADDEEHFEIIRALGTRSVVVVPLVARGLTLGVFTMASGTPRRYGRADLELAQQLAHRAALAIDNARLYREVQQADRRKSEFLAMLSHELRNPLTPIVTGLHLLDRAPADSPLAVRCRDAMKRQATHLSRLIDDLVDMTRITSGKIRLDRNRVELRDALRLACDDARELFESRCVALRVDFPEEPIWVEADATRLAQIVSNLLHNAAKFTPAGGSVVASATACHGQAEIRVQDTGMGMEPDEVERMFEPFAQADQGLARTHGGLGLGLAVAKRLVGMHGGRISGASAGRGRGSEFLVVLPLLGCEEAMRVPAAPDERHASAPS